MLKQNKGVVLNKQNKVLYMFIETTYFHKTFLTNNVICTAKVRFNELPGLNCTVQCYCTG